MQLSTNYHHIKKKHIKVKINVFHDLDMLFIYALLLVIKFATPYAILLVRAMTREQLGERVQNFP